MFSTEKITSEIKKKISTVTVTAVTVFIVAYFIMYFNLFLAYVQELFKGEQLILNHEVFNSQIHSV